MTKLNFSPGPARVPQQVKQRIAQELEQGSYGGMSVVEIGHRTHQIQQMFSQTEKFIRELLAIPEEYAVIFTQGGARGIFSALPLNFGNRHNIADYLVTGHWSEIAAIEAGKFLNLARGYDVTEPPSISLDDVDYVHFTDNETLQGSTFGELPKHSAPLFCDMTSSLFTKEINVSDYDLIYAAAQKNIGIAGVTLVIVKKALLGNARPQTPSILNLSEMYASDSMLYTPPVHAVFWMFKMAEWILEQGGVPAMAVKCEQNAQAVYDVIDKFDCYDSSVPVARRSRTNVVFTTQDDHDFLERATSAGFLYLKGHRIVGGVRASMYTGQDADAGARLAKFMTDYANKAV